MVSSHLVYLPFRCICLKGIDFRFFDTQKEEEIVLMLPVKKNWFKQSNQCSHSHKHKESYFSNNFSSGISSLIVDTYASKTLLQASKTLLQT